MSSLPGDERWLSFGDIPAHSFASTIGPLTYRDAGGGVVQVRMLPTAAMLNFGRSIHGGAVMTFIDMAIFAGGRIIGRDPGHYVTLDCATHFIARTMTGEPLDAFVRLVGQTRGGMVFMAGHCRQGGQPTHSFTGTLKRIRDKT
ncbi:MAG: PaaI family thioesterase [Sphingomicrobium sp.]